MATCMFVIIRPKAADRIVLCGLSAGAIHCRHQRQRLRDKIIKFLSKFTATIVQMSCVSTELTSVMSWLYKHLSWHASFSRLCLSIVAYFSILLTFKLNLRQAPSVHIVITTLLARPTDMLLLRGTHIKCHKFQSSAINPWIFRHITFYGY